MKSKRWNILFVLLFLAGLSLILYPTVSDWWNSFHQSGIIASYDAEVARLSEMDYDAIWSDVRAFNQQVAARANQFAVPSGQLSEYYSLLDVGGSGIIGYVEIPSVDISLPLYHGTDPAVLQVAVGHLDWSSLPCDGEGTHVVVSGHRGLPSAKLFTHVDRLKLKDEFMLQVLNETFTYEVDQILTVLPEDVDALAVEAGKEYCTLVTCTPYGVNSHRLLIRGHRVSDRPGRTVRVTADATRIEPIIVTPVAAIPMLAVLLLWLLLRDAYITRRDRAREKVRREWKNRHSE